MKIRFSQQTIYRLANCALREDTKFNDIDLTFEYAVVALRFLKNNIPEDVAQHLHSKLNGKFVLAAKWRSDDRSIEGTSDAETSKNVAYAASRKYNNCVTSFGGDQVYISPEDIAYIVNAGSFKYALIPVEE